MTDISQKSDRPAHPHRHHLLLYGIIILALFAAAILSGLIPRTKRVRAAEEAARRERESVPVVNVVAVLRSPSATELLLPGNISPVAEASIYARAAGYLRKRNVDIGDRVRRGQALAVIETPELDQQVAQARASLSQAEQQLGQAKAGLEQTQATLELARTTWQRFQTLAARGVVSRQEADQQQASFKVAQATVHNSEANVKAASDNVNASRANLDRILTMQEFREVRAPFDGIVTARSVDVGALISSSGAGQGPSVGSPGTSGELFRVAQIGVLRIVVNVPQSSAMSIHPGQSAQVTVQEFPNRSFAGRVARTANSLDPGTRTLLTEVQVPNPGGTLLPGMYAQVQFTSVRAAPPLLVPGDTILINARGPQVALFQGGGPGKQGSVHVQPVVLGRDYGPQAEIVSGINEGDWVIVNPSDDVKEGTHVTAQLSEKGAAKRESGKGGQAR